MNKFNGKSLENAVRMIESCILRSFPEFSEDSFHIGGRKIFNSNGVRHEVDVWVEIDHGKEYKSLFLFECKDWSAKIGKNEVIILAEKVNALNAQKGFLVAREFTRDAQNQAKKHAKLGLLKVTEQESEQLKIPFHLHFIVSTDKQFSAQFFMEEGNPGPLDVKNATALFNGSVINLDEYLKEWGNQVAQKAVKGFNSSNLESGLYPIRSDDTRVFGLGELQVNNFEVHKVSLYSTEQYKVIHPVIETIFDIETRGRFLSFKTEKLDHSIEVQVSLINLVT